jgi:hypothetical protein
MNNEFECRYLFNEKPNVSPIFINGVFYYYVSIGKTSGTIEFKTNTPILGINLNIGF